MPEGKEEVDLQEVKEFLRKYELKNLTYSQLIDIYQRNAFEPPFQNTLYSSLFLLFAPALTNVYYTFRPNSPLSKIMPFVMPVVALTQYAYFLREDMETFCFEGGDDAKLMREKYHILAYYENKTRRLLELEKDISAIEEKQKGTGP